MADDPLQSSTSPLSPNQSIPFSLTHPQTKLRLLELPPDLLSLLESDNRPEKLWFKSITPHSQSDRGSGGSRGMGGEEGEGVLHLVVGGEENDGVDGDRDGDGGSSGGGGKVYMIRQVSTSNSVYIIQPEPPPELQPQPRSMDFDTSVKDVQTPSDPAHMRTGMTAISIVENVLELIEIKPAPASTGGGQEVDSTAVQEKNDSAKTTKGKVDWHARLGRDRKR